MLVVDWLHTQARHRPQKVALVDLASGRSLTYRQFDERASRFAEVLRDTWGLRPGARVAVLAQNSSDYLEMLHGCAKAGVIMVCLNWRLATAELVPIVEDCAPEALVYDAEFAATAQALALRFGLARRMAVGASPAGPDTQVLDYEAALAAASGTPMEMPPRDENAVWHLLYTSGTTGKPKGVVQSHGMVFHNAVNAMLATRLSSEDVMLNVLPFFHTGGLNLYTNPVHFAGGTVLVMKQFDPGQAIELLSSRVTLFLGVPAVYLFMSQHPRFAEARFASMRHWSAGGSPMPRAVLDAYAAKGITICFGFGMTETGPTVFIPDEETARAKPGCVGKPVGSMRTRIVRPDGGPCAPGERGELLVWGPSVTPGYWKLPETTAQAIVDGWLHTGDVAYADEDGDTWIVDRVKDMFISGGENVYPAEVENVIFQMPGVAEVAVIGVPDPRWVEVGKACIVPKPGASLDAEAVRAHCRAQLAAYKVPKHVSFMASLPRTPAGKVEKPRLRAEHDRQEP